ncbi:MAG: hypothetical protein ACR2OU_04660 [Thermomicrobiales bacterium]
MSDTTTIEETTTDTTTETKPLGENGESALKAEREARKQAEKTARETAKELETLKAAKVKADEEKAAEEGRWKELAEKREASLNETATNLTSATTELDSLRGYFTTHFDAALKDLPDVVKAFAPDADASFETKSKWLTTAQAEAKKLDKQKPRGAGFDPAPGGNRDINEQQEVAKVRQRPGFRSL